MQVKDLMERTEEAVEFWGEEEMYGRLIRYCLDANDQEALEFVLLEAESARQLIEQGQITARIQGWEPTTSKRLTNWVVTGDPRREI